MREWRWISLVLGFVLGCESREAARPDPDLVAGFSGDGCSELARVVYDWQGRVDEACSVPVELRELVPLNDGYVLDWTARTGDHKLWRTSTAAPLGAGPINAGDFANLRLGNILVSLGHQRVLIVRPLYTDWTLVSADVNAPAGADLLAHTIAEGVFERPFEGRDIVALDDDFLLDVTRGSGAYLVRHVDSSPDALPTGITVTQFQGTKDELRRGAQLINLGGHRLLEWVPVTHHYRVWSYHLTTGQADIFDPSPVAEGDVPALDAGDTVFLSASDRLLSWERATGRVVLRVFDPTSPDPFGGAIVGDSVYAPLASPDWTAPARSAVTNLVIVLQRGRSFDSYFGRYCQAAPGAAPACVDGPACCEAMPTAVPGAPACAPLDAAVDAHVPQDSAQCLATKIGGGTMSAFALPPCGAPGDFACAQTGASAGAVAAYQDAAAQGSLADHFFQSTLGDAAQNLIYLSNAGYGADLASEYGKQITRLLAEQGVKWALYLDSADDTAGQAPPQFYDAHWTSFRAVTEIDRDVDLDQLGAASVVIAPLAESEQPGQGPDEVGIQFAQHVWSKIQGSPRYAPTTLVLSTFLTSGGFFDHVAPPQPVPIAIDSDLGAPVPYGPRVPLLALGAFALPNHVSHVPLELSSITRFLEWNWLPDGVGALTHRDQVVANLGSLLDPTKTGVPVP
ncbi:MAG TPA: alkaline phosphatase family protein [Polyangia bacterium]|nr:alkaline phosphatase family protein [Polyangia bacterium]